MIRKTIGLAVAAATIVAAGYAIPRGVRAAMETLSGPDEREVPTGSVRRGRHAQSAGS